MDLEQELNALRAGAHGCADAQDDDSPSVKEMNELAQTISDLRHKEEEAADVKKSITASLEAAENRMVELLLENNLKNYRAPAGLSSLSFRTSVKTPKTPEQIKSWLGYLIKTYGSLEQACSEGMLSTNSQKLCSYYKEQLELAKENGLDDVQIPGLTEVTITPNLSFKRPK